ncbi:hypothetical protein Q3G72_011415 [Acer saccharum]|nr:hypothetical protein Q3G72_011415 [Acer saccharum]
MYGNHRPRYPSGGGGAPPPPPPHQPQPPQLNPNFAFQSHNIYFYNPNPDLQRLHNRTNILLQNPNLLYHQQFHPNPNTIQPQIQTPTQRSPQPQKLKKEVLEKIDRAVLKERNRIIAAGEGVTAWKICQCLTLMLEVDSWSSLGFQMKEVPSLRKLMVTEATINAFIHCFVEARKITTLYDLEEAICKNESIGTFEELELGPFLSHQLVMDYFSVNSDITEVVKITNNDIIIFLCEYLDTHKKKDIKIDEFLDFIANKRSLASKEKLGVRINWKKLRMHIELIREARLSEDFFETKNGKWRLEDDGQFVKLDEDKSTRMFITTWKEACKDLNVDEVTSIKCGMWDSFYDTSQAVDTLQANIEVEPSKMAAAVNTESIVHHTHNLQNKGTKKVLYNPFVSPIFPADPRGLITLPTFSLSNLSQPRHQPSSPAADPLPPPSSILQVACMHATHDAT